MAGDRQEEVRAHFRAQAGACDRLGAPFTAGLCRALARVLDETTATGRHVLAWEGNLDADRPALRLCAGLHALVLGKSDRMLAAAFPPRSADEMILAALLPASLRKHDKSLLAALDLPPRPNGLGPAAMLLPGMLAIAREWDLPLDLHEIGAGAGLNCLADRFAYRFGGQRWGEAGATVQLAPELRGGRQVPLAGDLRIVERRPSDPSPVLLGLTEHRLAMLASIWPDRMAQRDQLEAAVELGIAAHLRVRRRSAIDAVRAMLDGRRDGVATVLMHALIWHTVPASERRELVELLSEAGRTATRERPLAWLRMEPRARSRQEPGETHAVLGVTLWPGGATRHLADCDVGGRWIAWKSASNEPAPHA